MRDRKKWCALALSLCVAMSGVVACNQSQVEKKQVKADVTDAQDEKETSEVELEEDIEQKEENTDGVEEVEEKEEENVSEVKSNDSKKTADATKLSSKKKSEKSKKAESSSSNTSKKPETSSKPSVSKPSGSSKPSKPSASKPSGSSKPSSSTTSKPSGSTKPSKPSNSGNSNANSNTSKPQKPAHTHNWVAQIKEVPHEATGHEEKVLVEEAWTEKIPIYETVAVEICNTCGADITNVDIPAHIKKHALAGEGGSHRTEYRKKQTGTETINHPAKYKTKWVQDSPAWIEKVVTGHKCSCGATK